MLTSLFHVGRPPAPHDIWSHWHPWLMGLLLAVGWMAASRLGGPDRRRLIAGLAVLGLALASPLDAASASLMTAHMAQHILLALVAAPLLAWTRPWRTTMAAFPTEAQRRFWRFLRRARLDAARRWRWAGATWLAYVLTWWFWHAAGPYEVALTNPAVHAAEHLTMLATAVGFWHFALGAGWPPANRGFRLLFIFTAAMSGVLLSALITFSSLPWYSVYVDSAPLWGVDPLTDQQLAGLLMWIPAGLLYTGLGLGTVAGWLRESGGPQPSPGSAGIPSGRIDSAPGPAGREPGG